MLISYNWIKKYFNSPLPDLKYISNLITKKSFEVESIEKNGDDFIISLDILPNRAHDCLCHYGIAKEISALLDKPIKKIANNIQHQNIDNSLDKNLSVIVKDKQLCKRYIARYIKNIKVKQSPKWLRQGLESIKQKSINNIVDATNFILFDIGQPLHIFDADKIDGDKIIIRKAKLGEKIITLDNKEIKLDNSMLVIADEKEPLAIAGIKGGKKAEVDENTKNIIIEAANFNPVNIRKTSRKINIITEASKRYENNLSSELADLGMETITRLIEEIAKSSNTLIGAKKDIYPIPEIKKEILLPFEKIENILGIKISGKDVEKIFKRLKFKFKNRNFKYKVTIPFERLDLNIPEDLVEEIGRIYGYDKIPDDLEYNMDFKPKVNKHFYYQNKICQFLISNGYSEIETYVFQEKGEIELANSFAQDKPFIRKDLIAGLLDALEKNARYIDLLDIKTVNIFEIGNVFTKNGEHTELGIAYKNPKKKNQEDEKKVLKKILKKLCQELNIKIQDLNANLINNPENGIIAQINFSKLLEKLPQPKSYQNVLNVPIKTDKYKPISIYPFIVRDIAVFINNKNEQKKLEKIILKNSGKALVKKPKLFDVFEMNKNGKTKISYAYRLVFQLYDRTLTNKEVNDIMQRIYIKIHKNNGWEVRGVK